MKLTGHVCPKLTFVYSNLVLVNNLTNVRISIKSSHRVGIWQGAVQKRVLTGSYACVLVLVNHHNIITRIEPDQIINTRSEQDRDNLSATEYV